MKVQIEGPVSLSMTNLISGVCSAVADVPVSSIVCRGIKGEIARLIVLMMLFLPAINLGSCTQWRLALFISFCQHIREGLKTL